jgi:uncharacterized membrane protein YkgB
MKHTFIHRIEKTVFAFVNRRGIDLLRMSLGVVFLWFGSLKFFDGLSPAEDLAGRTVGALSLGLLSPAEAVPILAAWETLMGLLLIAGALPRLTTGMLLAHLSGTVTPLFFYPGEAFTRVPYAPTLEGQYIIKNLVLASSALLVGAAMAQRALAQQADEARAAGLPAVR